MAATVRSRIKALLLETNSGLALERPALPRYQLRALYSNRTFVNLTQDRYHLCSRKSILSHGFLSSRTPSSQVPNCPRMPKQVSSTNRGRVVTCFLISQIVQRPLSGSRKCLHNRIGLCKLRKKPMAHCGRWSVSPCFRGQTHASMLELRSLASRAIALFISRGVQVPDTGALYSNQLLARPPTHQPRRGLR